MDKQTVLIIEDEEFISELIVLKFKAAGFKTYLSIDAEGGLRIMRQVKPDVVLLDLLLPGMSGFELMEQKMKDPTIASIPIVILSNLGGAESVKRGEKLGAKAYLIKTHFNPEEVVDSVRRVINKSRTFPAGY